MSLSDKSCLEGSGKQEIIVLKSFSDFPFFINKKSFEYFFHKIGTATLHHSLLTKRQECKEFSFIWLKIRKRQSTLGFAIFLFFEIKLKWDSHYLYNNFIPFSGGVLRNPDIRMTNFRYFMIKILRILRNCLTRKNTYIYLQYHS